MRIDREGQVEARCDGCADAGDEFEVRHVDERSQQEGGILRDLAPTLRLSRQAFNNNPPSNVCTHDESNWRRWRVRVD